MKKIILIFIIWIDSTLSWDLKLGSSPKDEDLLDRFPRSNHITSNDKYSYNAYDTYKSSNESPSTKTQYYYKTHQSGTVSIPNRKGSRVHVSPDENESEAYVTRVDTTLVNPRKQGHNKKSKRREQNRNEDDDGQAHMKSFLRTGKHCIKCPPEKILIAKRGLDGVLIELPQLLSCNDQPISKTLYELDSLFSHKHAFILPKGHHSFMGQIISKKNYTVEHICHLKYKIIVRQCSPYIPKNDGVKVKCDMGDIWGSKCTFFCRNNGILTHREPTFCNDNLEWTGEEPSCIMQHRQYFRRIEASIASCQLPSAPEHAKFSCKVSRDLINEHENELFIPDGTVCRVKCARLFEIPEQLMKYSTFHCRNGRWNYTHQNYCHKIQPKRLLS